MKVYEANPSEGAVGEHDVPDALFALSDDQVRLGMLIDAYTRSADTGTESVVAAGTGVKLVWGHAESWLFWGNNAEKEAEEQLKAAEDEEGDERWDEEQQEWMPKD